MTGLSPDTTYYVRAYATNTAGTVYGIEVNFRTSKRNVEGSSSGGCFITTVSSF
jgi:hypothetical protein